MRGTETPPPGSVPLRKQCRTRRVGVPRLCSTRKNPAGTARKGEALRREPCSPHGRTASTGQAAGSAKRLQDFPRWSRAALTGRLRGASSGGRSHGTSPKEHGRYARRSLTRRLGLGRRQAAGVAPPAERHSCRCRPCAPGRTTSRLSKERGRPARQLLDRAQRVLTFFQPRHFLNRSTSRCVMQCR